MTKHYIPEIEGVQYVFDSSVGQGGSAEVWKVRSSLDGLLYALKRIKRQEASSQREERFRKEIEFGITSHHPHVVNIRAQAETADFFYYVMDLYSHTLRDVISAEYDYETILDYLMQLCDAVAFIHQRGIVHRDIKPENILVDRKRKHLVLADFGIAHFKDSNLTKRGDLLANRNYLAPEQMAKHQDSVGSVREPADIFALGLITTELFTKQNPRGVRHVNVRDHYPFLAEIDALIERMLLQDESRRVTIAAVRSTFQLAAKVVGSKTLDIQNRLRGSNQTPLAEDEAVLSQAAKDILAASYIFERSTPEELALYNLNYHCEISYAASYSLYNSCVQSKLYSLCKSKFVYEAQGDWTTLDSEDLMTPRKASLLRQFESIQQQHPLPKDSPIEGLPRVAAHYFRFCKDYHCEELLINISGLLSKSAEHHILSMHHDLVDAPILGIVQNARRYLDTDYRDIKAWDEPGIRLDKHVDIHWPGTCVEDASRNLLGASLYIEPPTAKSVSAILAVFEQKWDASYAERADGTYSIYFHSQQEYNSFRQSAIRMATPYYIFRGDIQALLQPEVQYEELVALKWYPDFDIDVTLAKLLGLRKIK